MSHRVIRSWLCTIQMLVTIRDSRGDSVAHLVEHTQTCMHTPHTARMHARTHTHPIYPLIIGYQIV